MSKCEFMKSQVDYLGHLITKAAVAVDNSKMADMLAWLVPQSIKSLRGFLGLSRYYRKFVKDYGTIAKPLTNLLQKDKFHWTKAAMEAFNSLKQAMTNTPVLNLPDYTQEFTVETDASNTGIGAILTQEGHPLSYFNKALGPKGHLWKGIDGCGYDCQEMGFHLMDKHLFIKTDHQALMFLTEQKVRNLLQ